MWQRMFRKMKDWMGAPVDEELPPAPCPFCDDPVLASEASRWIPSVVLDGDQATPTALRAHVECICRQVHGSAGCQRGMCPNCAPPEGTSRRDDARAAYAVWQASQGRRRPKDEALS